MMHPSLLDPAVEISLETGGCIKFDLKAFDEGVHYGLTGVSNQRILENFAWAAQRSNRRTGLPLVIASTLLVPGYVGAEQVRKIAAFIAAIDPNIPYALLMFTPNFYMSDLPLTPSQQVQEAEYAARAAGLTNVHINDRHL
jgi:pyruvate formate lyase activating enzyme